MAGPITDIESKRREKEPKCEYCGGKPHPGLFACPRIESVVIHEDGDTTVQFIEGFLENT